MTLPDLLPHQWALAAFCALLIGFAKTGIGGMGTLAIPIMAVLFGGRASSGIVLPLLIMGDIIAVHRYRSHTEWKHVLRLLPWAIAGIIIGVAAGGHVSDALFKRMIGIIVLAGLVVMVWQEKNRDTAKIPDHPAFAAVLGLLGGFATMVGNAAGSIMAVYLLSMRLPKMAYIGTGAWFFMIVNLSKVPFQVIFWKGITPDTFALNLMLLPALILGAVCGIFLVKRLPEKPFRYVTMGLTAVASVKLFL